MDVLNLSLGGTATGAEENDLLAVGLNNAVSAGVVVAVAAGNSGPGAGTLESPGRASKVITVGREHKPTFRRSAVHLSGGRRNNRSARQSVISIPLPADSFDLFDTQSDGCTSVDPGASGKLAIIDRGHAASARKWQTRKPQVQSLFSSSTTSLEIPLQWRRRQASMMTYRQS